MFKKYLGEGYHDKIRTMLTADKELLPDRIIDAEYNIGAMKLMCMNGLNTLSYMGKNSNTKVKEEFLSKIAVYYLCAVLCSAMKSRTKSPPFNTRKYKKNWDKKREKYVMKGNDLIVRVMQM